MYVPSEELLKVMPGDFTIELKVEHTLLASLYFLWNAQIQPFEFLMEKHFYRK